MKSLSLTVCAALVLVGGLGSSCYNPKIGEGDFLCGAGSACPDGFTCMSGRCYKNGRPAADATQTPPMDAVCSAAVPCSPPTGEAATCDLVCQSGCGCNERCTYSMGSPTCRAAATEPRDVFQACDPGNDTCRPGTICLSESSPTCGAHCYRFCRVDSDCGLKARCTGVLIANAAGTNYKVCSPEITANCEPTGPTPRCPVLMNKPFPTFACYILSQTEADKTVCDCAGTKRLGEACEIEHECLPGLECVRVGSESLCRPLCTPDEPSICTRLGQRCVPFATGRRYGYCAP